MPWVAVKATPLMGRINFGSAREGLSAAATAVAVAASVIGPHSSDEGVLHPPRSLSLFYGVACLAGD